MLISSLTTPWLLSSHPAVLDGAPVAKALLGGSATHAASTQPGLDHDPAIRRVWLQRDDCHPRGPFGVDRSTL